MWRRLRYYFSCCVRCEEEGNRSLQRKKKIKRGDEPPGPMGDSGQEELIYLDDFYGMYAHLLGGLELESSAETVGPVPAAYVSSPWEPPRKRKRRHLRRGRPSPSPSSSSSSSSRERAPSQLPTLRLSRRCRACAHETAVAQHPRRHALRATYRLRPRSHAAAVPGPSN